MKKLPKFFGIVAIAAIVASCGSTKEVEPLSILTATNWELSQINGNAVNAAEFSRGLPTATFTTDNKITGNGGCNSYSGSYNLNDEEGMNVSQVISTKMACEGVGENEYFMALDKVKAAKVEADKLTLMDDKHETLVFVPKK